MAKKQCGIYCIENIANHKRYIGQSVDIKKRWREHKIALRNNHHCNQHLQRAWNTYGADNFVFQILTECECEKLNDLEMYYISQYNANNIQNGYNLTDGGNGCRGLKLSDEQKRHISEIQKGRKLSEEWIQNIKNAWRDKINSGFMPNVEHFREYNEQQKVRINCYDLNGNFIKQFNGVQEAARELEIVATNISKVLKNKYRYTEGYVFYYADIENPSAKEIFLRCSDNPVVLYDKDNNEMLFHNHQECGKYIGADSSWVNKVTRGVRKTIHGYRCKNYYDVYPSCV